MKILEDPEVFNKIRTINNWWEMRKQSFELQLDIYKWNTLLKIPKEY